jgi:hypothetical protein
MRSDLCIGLIRARATQQGRTVTSLAEDRPRRCSTRSCSAATGEDASIPARRSTACSSSAVRCAVAKRAPAPSGSSTASSQITAHFRTRVRCSSFSPTSRPSRYFKAAASPSVGGPTISALCRSRARWRVFIDPEIDPVTMTRRWVFGSSGPLAALTHCATAAVRALPFPRDLFACRNAVQPDLKHTLMSSTGSSVSRTTASTWASAAGTPTPSSGTPASPQATACAATARRYSTPASPAAPATLPRPARGAAVPSLPTQVVPRSTYLPQAAPECDSPRLDANLSLQSSTVTLLDQENRQGLWVACPDCHAATALAACCGHGPKVCPPELVRVLPWSGHPPRQRPRRGGNRGDVGQVRGSGAPEFPNRAVIAARPEQRWSRRRFCCPPGPPAARFRAGAGPAKAVLSFDG